MSVKLNTPRLVIAAPHSGAGKTTVTMGLAAWLRQEMDVSAFKVGPDYVDPGYLEAGTGRPAVNLDGWLLAEDDVKQVFYRHASKSHLALIEGVMGLFDGRGCSEEGSAAQIARWLDAPVILVVDAARSSRSLAALVSGFRDFDKRIRLAGVFLNRIGSDSHLDLARQSIERHTGVPVIGHLPNDPGLAVASRHLGLTQLPRADLDKLADRVASALAARTRKDALLALAAGAGPVNIRLGEVQNRPIGSVKIAVAKDEAFSFYYHDNLTLLQSLGAQILYFSPLNDETVPAGADGLFFGGGWPELHADKLAGNEKMRRSVLEAAEKNIPIYAECGGLIYLTESVSVNGRSRPMVGVLPATAAMKDRRQGLGYREAKFNRQTILGDKGVLLRGHEFHWSTVIRTDSRGFDHAYEYQDGRLEGFASEKVLASYLHLNWNSRPQLALNFINSCKGAPPC